MAWARITRATAAGSGLLVTLAATLLAMATARGEEAGGRSLEIGAATLSPSLGGVEAPLGFQYLTLELRFANTGDLPLEGVALGAQSRVVEDVLFPYFTEQQVGPVDQSALWQPVVLAPQQGIDATLVVAVPSAPGALALVYEADGVSLQVPVEAVAAPEQPAAQPPVVAEETPQPAEPAATDGEAAAEGLPATREPPAGRSRRGRRTACPSVASRRNRPKRK